MKNGEFDDGYTNKLKPLRLADEIYLGFGTPDFYLPQDHQDSGFYTPYIKKEKIISPSSKPIDSGYTLKDFVDLGEDLEQGSLQCTRSASPSNTPPTANRLALRSDVMNKNFFRAFRRECKTLFSQFLNKNLFSASKNKRVFTANLGKYSAYLLNDTETGRGFTQLVDSAEFEKYLGSFVNTCVMKKRLTNTNDIKKLQDFNEILYSYSHKKFKDFLAIPEVVAVVKIVLSLVSMGDFISHNPALAAKEDEYTELISEILEEL